MSLSAKSSATQSQATVGAGFALICFTFWGVAPAYFKAVSHIPPVEVLAHRVLWSVVFLILILAVNRGFSGVVSILKNRRARLLLMATTAVIATNWLIFIWAVGAARVLETSLGYYINPLISVAFGAIFLRERLRPVQFAAVLLAAVGVMNLVLAYGIFPWVALSLALLFAIYGLLRKMVPVHSLDALLVETLYLLPLAAGYLIFLNIQGEGKFLQHGFSQDLLLMASGPITALPLIWFASAARRLTLSAVGLFQYLAPTISFMMAVFIWNEPFTQAHFITFTCIWVAVIIFSGESLRIQRKTARAAAAAINA